LKTQLKRLAVFVFAGQQDFTKYCVGCWSIHTLLWETGK